MVEARIKNLSAKVDVQQLIKWVVYTLLIVNFVCYVLEDWNRADHSLRAGASLFQWTKEFAVSIDEVAWFALLFMFELDTYALSDETLDGAVSYVIRGVRIVCYILLAHTLIAYTSEVIDLESAPPVDEVSSLCDMTEQDVSFVNNLKYTVVDENNCKELTAAHSLFWTEEGTVVSDAEGLALETRLAWIDLFEASVWLLIVFLIEFIVWLQEREVTSGPLLRGANYASTFLYLILISMAAYWGWLSHWLYVWDELLWIGGFAAIEMNMSDWRDEIDEEQALAVTN